MTSDTPAAPRVELMKTLDEKFIATALMFEEAVLAASVEVDGAMVRTTSGAIDRDRIERIVARAINTTPSLRLRLRNTPLGVTAPAWVDAGAPALDYHLRYADTTPATGLSDGALLSGRGSGPMRLDKPLWDVRVADLESGDVSVIIRAHHAFGDGMYGLRILDAMSESEPFDPSSNEVDASTVSAPSTGVGVLLEAYRAWLADFPLGPAAWKEYWRKPFLNRMKRWGGRLLRPSRRRAALRAGLPAHLSQRNYRVERFDFRGARARARQLGGTVNDLVVASALQAALIAAPEAAEVSLLIPISRKTDRAGDERNHVSMATVTASGDLSLEELIASVHAQMEEVRVNGSDPTKQRESIGYATYLPWNLRKQFFGVASIKTVTLWPTIAPHEVIAMLASSYHDTITFAIAANRDVDLDRVVEQLHETVGSPVSPRADSRMSEAS